MTTLPTTTNRFKAGTVLGTTAAPVAVMAQAAVIMTVAAAAAVTTDQQ